MLKKYYIPVIIIVFLIAEFVLYKLLYFNLREVYIAIYLSIFSLVIHVVTIYKFKKKIANWTNVILLLMIIGVMCMNIIFSLKSFTSLIIVKENTDYGVIVFGDKFHPELSIKRNLTEVFLNSQGYYITSSSYSSFSKNIFIVSDQHLAKHDYFNNYYPMYGKIYSKDSSKSYDYFAFYIIPKDMPKDSANKHYLTTKAYIYNSLLIEIAKKLR